jgi:hypothetical protein
MKQFTKTIVLTFDIEHVSDDPEYEALAGQAIADTVVQAGLWHKLNTTLHDLGLDTPITAGGLRIGIEVK